ncbi:MAG TPA: hypothetical protein VMF08_13180 [Candidatus Sulfotelmatobacter sp.]|nr:hypothetical protein [Candidatus Sulfotelmatobacter sp.]
MDYVRYYAAVPQIVQNLPAQVHVPAGNTYTYSVSVTGPAPYSYNWFGPIHVVLGTNSTYTAPAGVAGTSRPYYVIITNIYGAVTSSVSTLSFIPTPSITNSYASNALILDWPADSTGWILQAQTNWPGAGIGTNWANVSGSTLTNTMLIPINPTNGNVFYRLAY